ncbi:IS3 family transposase [Mesobacillus sp. AQ2]|uniref:IS3 family transposase n=1 Tax=Mesobacillus sp. AQ2 TaxID=3043332 RepID=UPI0024C1B147|nr:IS3 family transposase [Mesobacillus sp. AQ2]WHX42845.1 IS3 family transposase [Mesobacillus sp. AQ2]WHX42972.1 IS3 family transposase [Mesobacillus sp. AQ2]
MHSERDEHSIVRMCKALGVTTSGYYAWLKRQEQGETEKQKQDTHLDKLIISHFYENLSTFGSPRIHKKLVTENNIKVSQKKVANRMRALGLYATPPKKYVHTTDSNHDKRTYPNVLDRNFNPKAPNKVWVTDITYIHTGEGFIYLNPVIDLFSRRVISYAIDDNMEHTLPLRALNEAIALRNPEEGWIHHSDRGSQYCSNNYIEALKTAKATISMSRKATPYDNACVESFFASLKKEYLYKFVFPTKAAAVAAVEFYVQFYNRKRIHSTLEYATPIECELAFEKAQREDANKKELPSA